MSSDTLRLAKPWLHATVIGRAGDDKVGPVSSGHIDWSLKGLRSTVRHFRPDVQEMAAPVIQAEEENRDAPRYAAYSVWVSVTCACSLPTGHARA